MWQYLLFETKISPYYTWAYLPGNLVKDFLSEAKREEVLKVLEKLGRYEEASGVRNLQQQDLDNYRCCISFLYSSLIKTFPGGFCRASLLLAKW